MKHFWTVLQMELLLFRRRRMSWFLAIFVVFWGFALVIGAIRFTAYNAWFHFGISYLVLTLLLTLLTGNQIQRDREQRLDSVVWSTPVATVAYVGGKYLASLLLVISFAMLNLLTSVIADLFLPVTNAYPPLGSWPYLLSWSWLVLPTLVFGATLTLCSTTLSRQRIVSTIIAVLLWLLPVLSGGALPGVLSITGSFLDAMDPAKALGLTFGSRSAPSANLAQQVVHLVQVFVPQAHLTPIFLVNRLLFLSLAVLLLIATMWGFRQQRQGRM